MRPRLGLLAAAAAAGLVGGAVFASLLLIVVPPSAGIGYWAPVGLATLVALGAAFASQLAGTLQAPAGAAMPEVAALSFSAAPPGGLLPTPDAMIRFDEELRLASEYSRPLCVALCGLDADEGVDRADALEALRQLSAGAVRAHDVVTDRGSLEVLLMLLETSYSAGWVVMERIHHRVAAAGVGDLRCVLVAPHPDETLREVLDELDSGLEACREMGVLFADPTRLLAPAGPG